MRKQVSVSIIVLTDDLLVSSLFYRDYWSTVLTKFGGAIAYLS
jgi:hypothetical protein